MVMAAEAQIEVLDGWSRLTRMVPADKRDPAQLPGYLATVTGVPRRRVLVVRSVRNRIAHEGTHSVSDAEARQAAQTIRQMEGALAGADQAAAGAAAPPRPSYRPGSNATASVVFYRPLRWGDMARAYTLQLDGVRCGKIRVNQELAVGIAPGFHTAEARIDWSSSPPLRFHAQPGQVLRIRVKPADIATQVTGVLSFNWKSMLHLSID
jgi:hypothetical protein